jgi:spermidine synthase
MLLHTVIFVSGGAILALELLASRIMTPYFGVSLYIWTGILSITLIALAVGYWGGGKLANSRRFSTAQLLEIFGLMPALAALFIVAAGLLYPFVFAPLANWSLIVGAFAACLILLAAPLIATSAMNPLLVAVLRQSDGHKDGDGDGDGDGDAGSGQVFFISTIGSVAGVLVTAFGLIPYISNYDAVLIVAAVLAALGLVAARWAPPVLKRRVVVMGCSLLGLAAALLLLWQADNYTGRAGIISYRGSPWRIEASFRSLFGTVKILKQDADAQGNFSRLYFQDGISQNAVDNHGASRLFYTYALEALTLAYRPDAQQVLVLGLGAGMAPARLAARGVHTEIVEIDPASLQAAQRFFALDESKTPVYQTDARTFVQRCPRGYDVIVVDLFHGDGTPDYLITREFFRDLKRCLGATGVAVFNTFADLRDTKSYAHLLATLRSELPQLALYRLPSTQVAKASHTNSFIVASATVLPEPVPVHMAALPQRYEGPLRDMIAAPLALTAALFEGGQIITDARNGGALDIARAQRVYRQIVIGSTPAQFLLN